MSLLFFEGFQGITTSSLNAARADIAYRFDTADIAYVIGASLNQTLYQPPSPYQPYVALSPTSNLTKIVSESNPIIVGMRVQPAPTTGILATTTMLRLSDSTGTIHGTLRFTTTGSLQVWRGDVSTFLSSSLPYLLEAGQWYYIELKYHVGDAGGGYEVRLDGRTVLTGSAADTRNGGNENIGRVRWGGTTGEAAYDDLYIANTSGSVNNDFLGDVAAIELLVDGNGNINNFVANTGTNYTAVRDIAGEDADTTFVSSSVSGAIDLYTIQDPTFSSTTIRGVSVLALTRKTEVGDQNIQLIVSGAQLNSSSNFAVESAYQEKRYIWEVNPETSTNWTVSDINNLDIGFKLPE